MKKIMIALVSILLLSGMVVMAESIRGESIDNGNRRTVLNVNETNRYENFFADKIEESDAYRSSNTSRRDIKSSITILRETTFDSSDIVILDTNFDGQRMRIITNKAQLGDQ